VLATWDPEKGSVAEMLTVFNDLAQLIKGILLHHLSALECFIFSVL